MCDLPVCDCWLYVQITGMCTLLTCVYLCVCIPGCVLWDIAGIPGLIAKIREACVNNSRIQQSCAKEPCLHNVNKLLKLVKAEGIHIQREREREQASNHKLSYNIESDLFQLVGVGYITNQVLWNHHYYWGTNVHGFIDNPCPRIYFLMNIYTSICLIFIYEIQNLLPRKLCPHQQGKFRLATNIDPRKKKK